MYTKPTVIRLFSALKLLFLILIGVSASQCQNFYVPNSIPEPNVAVQLPLFNGSFSWAELIKEDSLSNSANAITFEQDVLNSSFDFSQLLPVDSSYYKQGVGFTIPNGLGINDPDTIYFQQNQLDIINVVAPTLVNSFTANNLGTLHYFGFPKNGMSISSQVEVFDDIISDTQLNQGRLNLKIENTLDFPVNFKVSVLSGNDTIFKSVQSMNAADTVIKDLNIAGRILKPNNRIVISEMSSSYDSKTPITVDNSNGISVRAYYYNLNGLTGQFIPQPFSSMSEETLTIPVKNPTKLKSFSSSTFILNHTVFSSNVEGGVKMRRTVFDKTGMVFSDSLYLYNPGNQINWPLDLSGVQLTPDNGTIKIRKEFIITDDIHVSLGAFPYVSSAYNFSPGIQYQYFETTEEKQLTVSQTNYPQNLWPTGITVDMTPRASTANGKLDIIGWGKVELNTKVSSVTGGVSADYVDTNTFNLGGSIIDSSTNSSLSWSTTSEKLGEAIYFLADEIVTTSTLTFKGAWGIHLGSKNSISTNIQSPLDSKQGSFHIETNKTIEKAFNNILLEELYSSDSILLITEFSHNRDDAFNLSWSIQSEGDTISKIDSLLISQESIQQKIISVEQAVNPWEWNLFAGFEGNDIVVRNRDSLTFNVLLKYFSRP